MTSEGGEKIEEKKYNCSAIIEKDILSVDKL